MKRMVDKLMVGGIVFHKHNFHFLKMAPTSTGPRSFGNVSDCRSRGCEFDPGPVPYFRGD